MLGVSLLYVGIVLIINGIGRLSKIDSKSVAVMNIFTGGLGFVINVIAIAQGQYYAAATGLLFAFTYLFIAVNSLFSLDGRVLGWFSLFVAVNTVPCALISLISDHSPIFFGIWILWGVLWFLMFVEIVLKKDLKYGVPVLLIFEGIVTAWIPGFLLLVNVL